MNVLASVHLFGGADDDDDVTSKAKFQFHNLFSHSCNFLIGMGSVKQTYRALFASSFESPSVEVNYRTLGKTETLCDVAYNVYRMPYLLFITNIKNKKMKYIQVIHFLQVSSAYPNLQALRFKRESEHRDRFFPRNHPKNRFKRKLGKFFKGYGRKYTKPTTLQYEIAQDAGSNKNKKNDKTKTDNDNGIKIKNGKDKVNIADDKFENGDFEIVLRKKHLNRQHGRDVRNLRDVYYKAISDANKKSTAKIMLSKGTF